MHPRRLRRFRFNFTAVDSSVNSSRDVNFTAMMAYPLHRFIVENENLAMVLWNFDFWPEPPPASHVAAFFFLFFVFYRGPYGRPRARRIRAQKTTAQSLSLQIRNPSTSSRTSQRRQKEVGDGSQPRTAVGFEDIGRLEVDLDDYADGVKWVKDRKEKDWGKHTFRYCKAAPPRAKRKKAVKNSFNSVQDKSEYREYQLKAEVVRAICKDWQDAKKEQDGNGLLNWRYEGMNAVIHTFMDDMGYYMIRFILFRDCLDDGFIRYGRVLIREPATSTVVGRGSGCNETGGECSVTEIMVMIQSREEEEGRKDNVPLRRLAHALHDAVDHLLPAFPECGQGILAILLVRRELEQTREEVLERHLAVLLRPCSRTVSMMIRMGISAEMEERTVLDGAPLALRDLAEYRANLSQQLVDDPVLGALLKVLEGVLEEDDPVSYMQARPTCR
ncbi:hypothetical protein B0H13DRAFT_1888052 [Mycena leptocephala]|nr:hypothetical protein B0H13DRAFT_1888052 [Mycena leptocephala]